MDLNPHDWLTVAEAADQLGVSHSTIRRLCDDGTLTAIRLRPTSPRRIKHSSVEALVA